ncbi:nucleotidyl transferase AbiEii/AbiGii toxin family protein [Coprococcus eutactus]|uniref:nucleotidyl transferase AbiEii/AbiGii toxin family protein n=1 Tax=Coprococcus eutactus TaxID=33043 RepID=UPI001EDE0753|nr:nucleotidyl transferase AbiEii/AbiGii toxin family protein [Coprococcus eutactus]MCG4692538.1 nucleotidyl transferase AbiEii/AbiGii toxin family protein [Coprococcus eutactus]
MMNVDSVKARLKNFAIKSGCTFQEALTYYGLERTIYRISISEYADNFVLKGGIFLYALFGRNYERATTDVDLLAQRISNGSEEIKSVFQKIFSRDVDDALVFDVDSITVEDITEFKEYHGLHVSFVGYLDRTKIPISIDIGFGDVIYPEAVKMDFPVILDMESPRVNAYSLETSIAEKLEAIIHNGYLNSRYKDFYDIYVLSKKYEFSYAELRNAVIQTFENRKTPMTMDSAAFSDEFLNDPMHQTRWKAFLKKKKALIQVSMSDAMDWIKAFVRPLFEGAKKTRWNHEKGIWE